MYQALYTLVPPHRGTLKGVALLAEDEIGGGTNNCLIMTKSYGKTSKLLAFPTPELFQIDKNDLILFPKKMHFCQTDALNKLSE